MSNVVLNKTESLSTRLMSMLMLRGGVDSGPSMIIKRQRNVSQLLS